MSFPKFERVKSQKPSLAPELDRLMSYIDGQIASGQSFIIPKLAGAALKFTDGEAFVLLETLATAGVIERAYNVYCRPNDRLLATVSTPQELDDLPYCDSCDKDHSIDELKLELAFRIPQRRNVRSVA
jgi:hypothetical protein